MVELCDLGIMMFILFNLQEGQETVKIVYLADHLDKRKIVAGWFLREWGERYPERDLNGWAEAQTYPNKGKLPVTLLALDGDEVMGTVCLRQDGMTTHPEWKAWVSYLVVSEIRRGKGIAKALVCAAEEEASQQGIEELHLFTRLTDPKLYTNLGWQLSGKEEYHGGSVSIFRKIIPYAASETMVP